MVMSQGTLILDTLKITETSQSSSAMLRSGHRSKSFSRRIKHILAGGCKQRAKYTPSVFWRLDAFFCCCSTEIQHGKISEKKIQSGTLSRKNFFCTLQNATMNQSKRVVFSSARASISACSLWRRGSQVVCRGRGRGRRSLVAMETPRYQLYQPPCLTQIFFFPPRHPPSDYKCFSPAPGTDSVMVQSNTPPPKLTPSGSK